MDMTRTQETKPLMDSGPRSGGSLQDGVRRSHVRLLTVWETMRLQFLAQDDIKQDGTDP